MRKMRSILILCLVAVLALGIFTGCESTADRIEKLSGVWYIVVDDSEDEALALLESIDLYEEEIAVVDTTVLDYVKIVEFTTNNTYRFAYDVEGTKACVREYYISVFEDLYENRASLTSLNDLYGVALDQLTEDEFRLFYASLYEQESFESMIDLFTDNAYDYASLSVDIETGTYTLKGSNIMCTITGEIQAEALGYKISGDSLTLTYIDAVEVYSRSY